MNNDIERYFKKGDLIPAIVREESTGEVLMLAYMNRESLAKLLKQVKPGFTAVPVRSFGIRGQPQVIFRK